LLANIFTNIFVCFCWIFFRSDNFSTAGQIITRIFTWQDGIIQIYTWLVVALLIIVVATVFAVVRNYSVNGRNTKPAETNGFYPILDLSKYKNLVAFFVVIGIIIALAYTGANPFIYFQF
jgi:alginate O-acetyltransferase complex protein AlgI